MLSKSERLDLLISHYADGNKAAFARMLEMPRQSLNNWYIHESFDIEKLYRVCDGVSADWLLTGEGEMLKENIPITPPKDGSIIPFINENDLLSGNWLKEDCYIIEKGISFNCDFITRLPSADLKNQILPSSLLGCCFTKYEGVHVLSDLPLYDEGMLYIVKTQTGLFFVELEKITTTDDGLLFLFKTSRETRQLSGGITNAPDLRIEMPESDIIKCAEIVWHIDDHPRVVISSSVGK